MACLCNSTAASQPLISSWENPFIRGFATIWLLCACSKVLIPPVQKHDAPKSCPALAGWTGCIAMVIAGRIFMLHDSSLHLVFLQDFACIAIAAQLRATQPTVHFFFLASYLCTAHFPHEEAGKIDSKKLLRTLPAHVVRREAVPAECGAGREGLQTALEPHCNHQAANKNHRRSCAH